MLDQCPICSSRILEKVVDYPRSKNNNFYTQIINCSTCKSGIAIPYKNQDELNDFYNSGVYWENASSEQLNIHTLAQAESRVDYVFKRVSFKNSLIKILDVGAGHGHIATAAKAKNSDYSKNFAFIEPDSQLSETIQLRIPGAIRKTFNDPGLDYDLIFLNHILEHTASPLQTLKIYRNSLKTDGKIYIEVPHRDDYFKNDVFPHSIFFSKNGLRTMIELSGLKCSEINCFGSVETIKYPTALVRKIRLKTLGRLYAYAVKNQWNKFAKMIDGAMFDYKTERPAGIWIRALCSK